MHFLFGLKVMCAIKNDSCHERLGEVEAGLGTARVAVKKNKPEWTKKPNRNVQFGAPKQVKMFCHILGAGCEGGDGIVRKEFLAHLLLAFLP